jgi:GDPmannose 4,6-dehydratase
MQDHLYLGNLSAKRDWGHAKDYVEAQWLMLQQKQPEDFVIATGSQHSVREFVEVAADALKMTIRWRGRGVKETGHDAKGKCIVSVDARYFRPAEVDTLLGDASKARARLGWTPKVSFERLVKEMATYDLRVARNERLVERRGGKLWR